MIKKPIKIPFVIDADTESLLRKIKISRKLIHIKNEQTYVVWVFNGHAVFI